MRKGENGGSEEEQKEFTEGEKGLTCSMQS